jgi:hypothetical protein
VLDVTDLEEEELRGRFEEELEGEQAERHEDGPVVRPALCMEPM